MKRNYFRNLILMTGILVCCIPHATKTAVAPEILGIIACGYGIHVFAREDTTWLGSFVSLVKSSTLMYAGWALLGTSDGLQLLAANITAIITAAANLRTHEKNSPQADSSSPTHQQPIAV